jgi:hypothetical protein
MASESISDQMVPPGPHAASALWAAHQRATAYINVYVKYVSDRLRSWEAECLIHGAVAAHCSATQFIASLYDDLVQTHLFFLNLSAATEH